MNDTTITLRGNVGSDVVLRDVGETQVANFRVGATPRVLNRATGQWHDGVTQWYTVNAWRRLAPNVKRSIFKGDPVLVHGRLTVKEWADKDGVLRTTLEVEADSVGHDLMRGTTSFARPQRVEGQPAEGVAEPSSEVAAAPSGETPPWAVPGTDLLGGAAAETVLASTLDGVESGPAEGPGEGGDPVSDWRAA
ncbi:single-stranded DNA-binding protein [Nocardioides sp.]|uniref:single-stranded DNA-binding protein n=1 Tax=Nocardioides sp. TaxID=35761 RepID=UPI00262DF5EF|nr:single-stranded DNA-binding protein [Nocardioides sp.]